MANGTTPNGTPNGTTALAKLDLPEPVLRRGISEWQWRTLMNTLYPGAKGESVLLVWDYCKSRNLDPMKRPVHIVPMRVKVAGTDRYEWRDVVMPGIYEHRTTATRTGVYLGHAKPEYGPDLEYAGVTAPAWCDFTAYRWNAEAKQRAEFPVRTFFKEVCALNNQAKANQRWAQAPVQMLVKCAEAAALREAFPEELGGQTVEEEMDGQRAGDVVVVVDDKAPDLSAVADEGSEKLAAMWEFSLQAHRHYLNAFNPEAWPSLKARAERADAATKATGDLLS